MKATAKTMIAMGSAALLCLSFWSCGGKTVKTESDGAAASTTTESTAAAVSAGDLAYDAVQQAERISLEDALASLGDLSFSDPAKQQFAQQLKDLKACGGQFVQTSDATGSRYNATVTFYLAKGVPRCSVTYDGFLGEIADGDVTTTTEEGFSFAAAPKGDLFGNELDFRLLFGASQLRIIWGDSCDYLLTRGDGSVDSVQSAKPAVEDSEAFKTVKEMVDSKFGDYPHSLIYDQKEMAVKLFLEPADSVKAGFMQSTVSQEAKTAWDGVVNSMKSVCSSLTPVVTLSSDVTYMDICWVYRLDSGNQYDQSDYLLWIRNGEVQYNVMTSKTVASLQTAQSSSGSSSGASSGASGASSGSYSGSSGAYSGSSGAYSGSSGSYSGSSASIGERNALQKARDYLDFMAFSYTGLMEQLEYEGYSAAEAKYAVDHCGADWYEQARKKALDYLDMMSFSRSGLIEQLEYEGFTSDQATSAVNAVYR